jgi:hypothetical protein
MARAGGWVPRRPVGRCLVRGLRHVLWQPPACSARTVKRKRHAGAGQTFLQGMRGGGNAAVLTRRIPRLFRRGPVSAPVFRSFAKLGTVLATCCLCVSKFTRTCSGWWTLLKVASLFRSWNSAAGGGPLRVRFGARSSSSPLPSSSETAARFMAYEGVSTCGACRRHPPPPPPGVPPAGWELSRRIDR